MKKHFFFTIISLLAIYACSSDPIIGISSGFNGKSVTAPENYIKAVRKAGGIPFVLPRVSCRQEAEQLIRNVDGIVFTGGEDFDPALYGEAIINESVKINAARDTSDLLLIRTALEMGKPILGICRGMQGINVALGGSLFQDIPTQIPGSCHNQAEPNSVATHRVGLEGTSILFHLLGKRDSLEVNSFHHQAVKDPAPSLRITGYSADGIAEALEGDGIIATQFHPEAFIASGQDFYLPIFEELIRRSR